MRIVFLYAALLALLFVALSIRTIRVRRRFQVGVGDGGNQALLRAMRVHSNFAEYAPLALLLIFFVETAGASAVVVHVLGICLLAGRVVHAFGVSQVQENYRFRIVGMTLTFFAIVGASVRLLAGYVVA